jgi:hypothetical protein
MTQFLQVCLQFIQHDLASVKGKITVCDTLCRLYIAGPRFSNQEAWENMKSYRNDIMNTHLKA